MQSWPADVVVLVLQWLPLHDLIMFRQTCQRFDTLVAERFDDRIAPIDKILRECYATPDWYDRVRHRWRHREAPRPTRHEVMAVVAFTIKMKIYPFDDDNVHAHDESCQHDVVGLINGLHDNVRYVCVEAGMTDAIPRWYVHKYSRWFFHPI